MTMQTEPAELTAKLGRAVLPIYVIGKDGVWYAIGSCFVVAILQPKVAITLNLTAAHNLEHVKKCISGTNARHHATTPLDFRGPDPDAFDLKEREEVTRDLPMNCHRGPIEWPSRRMMAPFGLAGSGTNSARTNSKVPAGRTTVATGF